MLSFRSRRGRPSSRPRRRAGRVAQSLRPASTLTTSFRSAGGQLLPARRAGPAASSGSSIPGQGRGWPRALTRVVVVPADEVEQERRPSSGGFSDGRGRGPPRPARRRSASRRAATASARWTAAASRNLTASAVGQPLDVARRVLRAASACTASHAGGASTVGSRWRTTSPSRAFAGAPAVGRGRRRMRRSRPRSSGLPVATSRRIARGTMLSVTSGLPGGVVLQPGEFRRCGFAAKPGS